ncbi:2-succinyl-6-hydroxy-2,4-cyclohexadiene-1-carboxylate synthase [Peribacillus deserti]|uniref:Putative 2-succinyl-6-hydroxy-2,4-cyclohexadiene-1-carboxylate synthase n=1 Tax=Peribacillus deserti TaxID=673318 RepID=A0ABS2QIJ1_9BACI|nr:2-succinyl-6-hydroxy-2,4-cyclohexadiene-1-carboxylate synthase [Peribacillus deserti]MBM7692986.1 2-succinyl-6-hydroxy-2,4-cyclohexadiene-1-carboxylate synthase [Peribacillus deserti]
MKILCCDIEYNVDIRGQGDPLVLLHGFTGSSANWENPSQFLPENLQLIAIDIIGHGQTDSPADVSRYSMSRVVEDLKQILDILNIDLAVVLGYSMGGRLALSFAAAYPERINALILESSSPGLKTEQERRDRRQSDWNLAGFIEEKGVKAFIDYWGQIPLFQSQQLLLSKETQELIEKQRLNNSQPGLSNSLRGMGTGAQPSLWESMENLNFPVLLLTGSLDKKFCTIAKEMNELLTASEWVIIENAGHAVHVEQPEKFGKIVSDFLANRKG